MKTLSLVSSPAARLKVWLGFLCAAGLIGSGVQALDPGYQGRAPALRCLEDVGASDRTDIVGDWRASRLERRARSALWVDCAFPFAYVPVISGACLWGSGVVRRRPRDGARGVRLASQFWIWLGVALACTQLLAASADLVENASLLDVIKHPVGLVTPADVLAATAWKWRFVRAGGAFCAASFGLWALGPAEDALRAVSGRRAARTRCASGWMTGEARSRI